MFMFPIVFAFSLWADVVFHSLSSVWCFCFRLCLFSVVWANVVFFFLSSV